MQQNIPFPKSIIYDEANAEPYLTSFLPVSGKFLVIRTCFGMSRMYEKGINVSRKIDRKVAILGDFRKS